MFLYIEMMAGISCPQNASESGSHTPSGFQASHFSSQVHLLCLLANGFYRNSICNQRTQCFDGPSPSSQRAFN